MSGSYIQSDVICPFYKYDNGQTNIICEGITDECSTALAFRTRAAFKKHIELFCCEKYKNCEIARAIVDAKYID